MEKHADRDAIIVGRALERGGYLSRSEVRAAGFTRSDLNRYVRAGVLTQVAPRLLSVVDIPTEDPWLDRVWRVVGRCASSVVLAGETAARLHGIAGVSPVSAISIRVPVSARVPSIPGADGRRCDVPAAEIALVDGFTVTTPVRTVVDCLRFSDRLTAVCVLESAARPGLVTLAEVAAQLEEMRNVPHVRRAREALRLADVRSESPLETAVRLPLLDAGLPYPELQLPFAHAGIAGRIDLAYPIALLGGAVGGRHVGVAIEADGREWHIGADVFHTDRTRQTALEEAGWLVRRFTDQHARQTPAYVAETTRRAIATVLG